MRNRFDKRVVIVTGSSLGIGFAAAQGFAAEGAHVVLCARNEEQLKRAADSIADDGGKVSYQALDLADTDAFEKLIQDTATEHGRLDALVNNAAVTRHRMIDSMSLEAWRKNFCVTVDATFIGTKTAMAIMGKQEQGGAIVNVSSSCGSRATVGVSGYSAAKAAADSFSNCAAMEGATMGVRVNSVVPGSVATAASEAAVAGNQKVQDAIHSTIPMQRSGTPEEIAAAILFLASDEASFITGVELPVDGGKLAQLYVPTTLI
ncbi:MAG: SDR family oxidoreductase [Gammaproteobacteria bacterium]|nr:SDR family oxidoreductase [Gammaproteobacteria bacterium]